MVFLKECKTGELVEVLDPAALYDPFCVEIIGRATTSRGDARARAWFAKSDLAFCSNEQLPQCWMDPDYRRDEIRRTGFKADAVAGGLPVAVPERTHWAAGPMPGRCCAYVRPASRRVHCG